VGEESPRAASTPTGAAFLSYASEDVDAAERISNSLRAVGVEVWFDKSELRGGEGWDRQIRQQIHDCRLFLALISAHTESRDEGYFRREWRLAVERAGDMAEDRAFVVPVAIDSTSERGARVPDSFKHVQWTRLPSGEPSRAFVERIRRLMSLEPSHTIHAPISAQSGAAGTIPVPVGAAWSPKRGLLITAAVVVLGALAYFAIEKLWTSKPAVSSPTVSASPAAAAFNPPPHSVAVLPFVNMSGDKEQEYFSDGMTEELITALSQVSSLKVIARTSSFAFKGRNVEVGTIARALNVSSILEGSVRRAGSKVRVTVQLINGQDGFHVWSEDYDRDLKNILAMQSDIATAVAQQLKAKLVGDEPAKIEYGGTRNAEAYDAFLRGKELYNRSFSIEPATRMFEKSVQLDSGFARAWAALSLMYASRSEQDSTGSAQWLGRARAAAETAVRLAPRLEIAHSEMAWVDAHALDWVSAEHEVEAAAALDANGALNARGNLYFQLGRWQAAIAAARTAVALDPRYPGHRFLLAGALGANGQHREAELAYREIAALKLSDVAAIQPYVAAEVLHDNRPTEALAEAERVTDKKARDPLLAMIYYALGRRQESELIVNAYEQRYASEDAVGIAVMHAYRGETDLAFQWLDRAVRQHDPTLMVIKGCVSPFPNVTSDARYPELLKRLGLPVP
jgi:TolB-like protein/tetratricopeptide (TPR) repeat protein